MSLQHYANLSRAQLTYEYLHTNSTTHEFLFGALAELVDNSQDANASEMHIFAVPNDKFRGGYLLNFLDNGCGMDPDEVSQVIQFGRSSKRDAGANHIGQYGNGLKSGSMRIGKDMMVFTKKGDTLSCLFLSRTFHEREGIEEVIVPMPSWYVKDKKPYINDTHPKERHKIEVEIITKYSPYQSEEELLLQFDNLTSPTGTNVLIFNMKLLDNGEPELKVKDNDHDIVMSDPYATEVYDIDDRIAPERVSFRSYASILYCTPRMKIYIQERKVRTMKLANCLFKPRSYIYTSTRFKTRSEQEAEKAEKLAKIAEERAKELSTQAREANAKASSLSKKDRAEIQKAVMKSDEAKFDADVKKRIAIAKRKSSKEPKTLTFTFGFQVNKRRCDGIMVYNCNRLIKMYEKAGPQTEGGVKCAGLVGVVDVPYLVLEPTHNKQDFADHKEFKHLVKSMADHMLQYWKDSKIEQQGITKFWDDFGYSGSWKEDPSDDQKYKIKRMMSVPNMVQCDTCLKWRVLQFSRKMVNMEIPDDWVCAMNTDPSFQSCTKPEQKSNIPIGKLQKDIKDLDAKRQAEVKKLQEKLDQKQKEINKRRKSQPEPEPEPEPAPRSKSRGRRSPSPPPKRSAKTPPAKAALKSPPSKTPVKSNKRAPSPPPARSRKAKSPSPPPKRGRKAASPPPKVIKKKSPDLSPAKTKRQAAIAQAETESKTTSKRKSEPPKIEQKKTPAKEEEPPIKKSKAVDTTTINNNNNHTESETSQDEGDEIMESKIYPMDTKVEAKMLNSWYPGSVVAYKKASEGLKIRVKFEKHAHDKFDKWFNETDPNLRLKKESVEITGLTNAENSSENHVNSSSSSKRGGANSDNHQDVKGELLEKVTHMLRRCLCYFRAPDFEKEKKEILNLTPQELRDFPLSTFFDDYERNIKKQLQATRDNLSKRGEEAEKKLKEADAERKKQEKELKEIRQIITKQNKTMKELRGGVNVMLRSILNEDEKLDANDTSENVDVYLKTIVDQISETNS